VGDPVTQGVVHLPALANAPAPVPAAPSTPASTEKRGPIRPSQPIVDAVWTLAAWVIVLSVVLACLKLLVGWRFLARIWRRSGIARQAPADTASPRSAVTPDAPVLAWGMDLLNALEWKRFEELCQQLWILRGRDARLTGCGADGGIDVEVYDEDGKGKVDIVIQCKSWVSRQVGVDVVRATWGVRDHVGAARAMVYAVGGFTAAATDFAAGKALSLVDGPALMAEIGALPAEQRRALLMRITRGDYTTPSCPKCEAKMLRRPGKDGRADFWSCPRYPACRSSPIPMRA
jgi:restriction system protein